MSANDALYVQKNSRGQFVAQRGGYEGDLPDPEKADASETFTSLESLVVMTAKNAAETEYGLQIKIDASNSVIETQKYQRKPFEVDAVQVSPENMGLIAAWTGGSVKTDDGGIKYINIEVHRAANEKQEMAYENDWVLFAGQGFKIYTASAFKKSFVIVDEPPKLNEIRPRRTFRSAPKGPKLARNTSPESLANLNKVAAAMKNGPKKVSPEIKAEEVADTPQAETKTVYKSSETGGFVTKEYAEQNPSTTYAERVPVNTKEN